MLGSKACAIVTAVIGCVWQTNFAASAASVASIAQYNASDRQQILEAGARAEGELNLYSSNIQGDAVLKSFTDKYPFIRIGMFRGDGPVIVQKVFEEGTAGRFSADVMETASGGFQALIAHDMLQSYRSPELAAFREEAIELHGRYAFNYQSYVSLGFNTKLISEAEAPRTLDDLLDPKWRGKMAFPGSSTLANWVGATLRDKGEDYLRRLGKQDIRVFEISGRALANMVVSGETPMSPALFSAHIFTSKDQGASVAWRPVGGVYSNVSGVALMARAPHPHAAMLYIDFAFSRETQDAYQKLGYASARTDLTNAAPPEKFYYLSEEPGYIESYEKWTALGREIFGKGEPAPPVK